MSNRFDEFVYSMVHDLIEEHDDIVAEYGLRCEQLEAENAAIKGQLDLMRDVLKDLKSMTREWMKDLVYLTYTEEPEVLRGKIYGLVSAFPNNYRTKSVNTIKDVNK